MASTSKQKRFLIIVFLVLANSSYLAAYATPSIFYAVNVLLHPLLGLALVIGFVVYYLRRPRSLGPVGWAATLLLLVALALGLFLTYQGAISSNFEILIVHIALGAAALFSLAVFLRSRALALALVLAVALPAALTIYRQRHPGPYDVIVNPVRAPLSMEEEGAGPSSPFWPSAAETADGKLIPSRFFLNSEACARCHADIYKQWFASAHHFASFNNQWYRKSVEYMQDVIGVRPSKWCAGCHDHALIFTGMMDTPIRQIVDTPEAQAGLACVSCHSIVRVKSTMGNGDFVIEYPPLHDLATSENRLLRTLHDVVVNLDPEPHRRVFMKPFMRRQPGQFCAACHKVHLDVPVNNYRWVRGFNEYDNWQASGVSGEGARSFYYPPEPKNCVTCHMPLVPSRDAGNKNGFVRSHRFPAANTATALAHGEDEQLEETIKFLQANQLSVDIFAIAEPAGEPLLPARVHEPALGGVLSSTFAIGEEAEAFTARGQLTGARRILAPIDRVAPAVRRGDSLLVDVVVRTRNVGHFFPGGTVDAFDVWLELQAVDENGRIIFWSGMVEQGGRGPVEPGAHFYRSFQMDEHGNPINKRNAWATRSVLYVRLIPPGAADTVHFRLQVPENCGDRLRLTAKLNYRKFAWWFNNWAYAGERDPNHKDFSLGPGHDDGRWLFTGSTANVSGKIKQIPDLPIVTLASDEIELRVVDRNGPPLEYKAILDKSDRERWNDYGIGLLLQGDLKGAEQAFQKVVEIDPAYADGWVNIGRARLQEGNLKGAAEVLKKALALSPDLAKAHFFYAMVLKGEGNYDEALRHLWRVLELYPNDRVARNQAGRILFLQRRYREAIEQFEQTLTIDPEDLAAHYNLMLCYRGLGDNEKAEREYKLYLRYKANEASQFITGEYRRLHPEDNNERQPIHEHLSVPLDQMVNGQAGGG